VAAVSDLARQVRALIDTAGGYQTVFAARAGIGRTAAAALGHLYQDGPLTPTHLAARLQRTPASVSVLTDRLVTAGYLTRSAHPDDRRQVLLHLTSDGTQLIQDDFDAFTAIIDQAAADALPDRLRELSALLGRVTAGLQAAVANPTTDRH
jgi:DNA-binding MarR family transcriptional regulator